MSTRYLLDTNICIYVLADAHSAAAKRLEQCAPEEVVISAISCGEILIGAHRLSDEEVAKARAFFALFETLPFDAAAAESYGRLPFKRGSYDRLIAAHALSLGLTLVTNNEDDFADIPGLSLENWTEYL